VERFATKPQTTKGIVMLYRVSDLQGYTIHATHGDIGTLRTLYLDEEEWGVVKFVIDTGAWGRS